jgi:uncharacterized protein
MKKALFALCWFAIASSPVWAQNAHVYDDRPKISVSGEAIVYATPDRIAVQFGVETQDKNMVAAKQKSNDILKKVFAAMKGCGVKERDIQTQYLYAEPRWGQLAPPQQNQMYQAPAPVAPPSGGDAEEPRRFLGYFVKNVVVATVKDAAKIDKLIADVLAAGATHIYGVEFQTSELKTYREKAREMALKAAREKAVKMAAVLDQSVGPPIEISEWGGESAYSRDLDVPMAQGSVSLGAGSPSGEAAATIALGKIAIRASVNVRFELKR